jgi:hypothetical protein
LPETFHGKEGVGGSSPPEGSAKAAHTGLSVSDRLADHRTWGRLWSPLWSLQVETPVEEARPLQLPPETLGAFAPTDVHIGDATQ